MVGAGFGCGLAGLGFTGVGLFTLAKEIGKDEGLEENVETQVQNQLEIERELIKENQLHKCEKAVATALGSLHSFSEFSIDSNRTERRRLAEFSKLTDTIRPAVGGGCNALVSPTRCDIYPLLVVVAMIGVLVYWLVGRRLRQSRPSSRRDTMVDLEAGLLVL